MSGERRVSPHAKRLMEDLKGGSFRSSILLIGNRGLSMMEDAKQIASFLLGAKTLSSHPDFMLVQCEEGEKSIGVEVSDAIVARSMTLASVAERIVVIINDFEKMTMQAQNKLLKLLEESKEVIIIGVAYEDTLLQTVKSRMRIVKYQSLSYEEYKASLSDKNADPLVWYFASGGIPDIVPDEEVIRVFSEVKEAFLSKKPHLAFQAFRMVKEKDASAFFASHREYVPSAISFMGAVVAIMHEQNTADAGYSACVKQIAKHRERCNTLSYTKDSFFMCVAQVVETIGK